MNAIIEYIQDTFQHVRIAYQPALIALSPTNEIAKKELKSNLSFFVAKEFTKQAGYFFRVDSSQEYVEEPEVEKKVKVAKTTKLESNDLNYSVGLKRFGKILVFPLVFCWIVLETAFEFILDSDDEEVPVKKEKASPVSNENSYQSFK